MAYRSRRTITTTAISIVLVLATLPALADPLTPTPLPTVPDAALAQVRGSGEGHLVQCKVCDGFTQTTVVADWRYMPPVELLPPVVVVQPQVIHPHP